MRLTGAEYIRVVASGKWKPLVSHQLSSMGFIDDFVIEEPEARNTAPAIALGVAALRDCGANDTDIVLVCPSDHVIANEEAFVEAVKLSIDAASAGKIVTFGIKPTAPETGFGYIKTDGDGKWLPVDSFVEKPDEPTAKAYIESGNYFWNGGIFCFRICDIMSACRDHFPGVAHMFNALSEDRKKLFLTSPKESIDYAVMEKARNIACVPLDVGWSDVGSWDAVYENSPMDNSRNAIAGNVVLDGGYNNLVIGSERLICGIDLNSMIVIDTPDALFVSPRGASQKLRSVVRHLSKTHHDAVVETPVNARPWGTYSILSKGGRHKIKRIIVSPRGRLSLQYHLHRSEHWVVVQGTAHVIIYKKGSGDAKVEKLVHEGESVFVPKGWLHRMENPGHIPLEIIEVQIGEYVGEDDICRVEDDYKRIVVSDQ
jgi:mannose-1-phosphate guanylyltransferase/mannose-6-phosphate isomerase